MRVTIRRWVLCWGIAWAGAAGAAPGGPPTAGAPKPPPAAAAPKAQATAAAPKVNPQAQLKQAEQLFKDRQHKQALAAIAAGLAVAPKDLSLLYLKGRVLLDMDDYPGAQAAFQAFVAISPPGAPKEEAKKIIQSLNWTGTTFLEVTVANGPADIYVKLKAKGVFCRAEPSCKKPLPPGPYKVIAEAVRPGFQRWTGHVTVAAGQVTGVPITLAEMPSALTVRGAPPGATFTVDGAAWSPPALVAAGKHELVVAMAGYAEERLPFEVHEGNPRELDVPLSPLVQIRAVTPGAEVLLDGKPFAPDPRGTKLPPGPHTVVARAPGYRERRVAIPAERAAGYEVVLELDRVVGGMPPRRKLALGAAGLGVAAAGAGVVFGLRSGKLDDDAYKLCPDPSEPCADAAEANDLNARARSSALAANVAFGVAGGAAITAAVLWLTGGGHERRPDAPGPRVSVQPRLGVVSGLDLSVRF